MNYRKSPGLQMRMTRFLLLVTSCALLVTSIGCDAFVRKFTRKHKKEDLPREEMVLVPEVYKVTMTREEQYRQYFLFWKSWQDELIESLTTGTNHKKQVSCIDEAVKNLLQLKTLLNAAGQKKLEVYIGKLNDLKGSLTVDAYGNDNAHNRATAESIKRGLLRDFSYPEIKGDLA